MKNIFESLHLRKPKSPQTVNVEGGPSEDWEGTQVTLSGWKSLVNGDIEPPGNESEAPTTTDQAFEGFGAGVGNDVKLTGLPMRSNEDMDFLLDDLDINSTAPSSPALSYPGGQDELYGNGGGEIDSRQGFLGAAELDYKLQLEVLARQEESFGGAAFQEERNRALAELFGPEDTMQDGLDKLLSSFQEDSLRRKIEKLPQSSSFEAPFFDGEEAKQDEFLNHLLSSSADTRGQQAPFEDGSVRSGGVFGTLTDFDSRGNADLTKHQDSLPRISTLSGGLPSKPLQPPLSGSPEFSSTDDLCQKIASALAQKGVKPNGLELPFESKPQINNPPNARSAPTSPPETPRFSRNRTATVLRRTKSQHGTPRSLSPSPDVKEHQALSPNGTPSSVLTSGQRSPKRKDSPEVRMPSLKRQNGNAHEKSAQLTHNRAGAQSSNGPAKVGGAPGKVTGGNQTPRVNGGETVRIGLYYDEEGVPHWKGPAPKKGEGGYDDYLRYRQFLSAKARDKKAALQRIEKESHVRLQGTVETLDEQLDELVRKLQSCLSHQDKELPLRDILSAAEAMKQQVRQSLDWRQQQEAHLLDQASAEDEEKGHDSEEPDTNGWS